MEIAVDCKPLFFLRRNVVGVHAFGTLRSRWTFGGANTPTSKSTGCRPATPSPCAPP